MVREQSLDPGGWKLEVGSWKLVFNDFLRGIFYVACYLRVHRIGTQGLAFDVAAVMIVGNIFMTSQPTEQNVPMS